MSAVIRSGIYRVSGGRMILERSLVDQSEKCHGNSSGQLNGTFGPNPQTNAMAIRRNSQLRNAMAGAA